MSMSEQDAIIGRTLREHQEAKKALAALFTEAERFGNYLTAVGHALRAHHSLTSGDFQEHTAASLTATSFLRLRSLSELVAEIDQTTATKKRLAETLRNAGYDIKD